MPRGYCRRHGPHQPCTCAMGNLYRFVEPVVLYALKVRGESYGYDLAGTVAAHALTDAEIERASLYRTLKQLEANGYVRSRWETDEAGPARRIYRLTPDGERHLEEWVLVLERLSGAMNRFVRNAREALQRGAPVRDGEKA